MYTIVLTDLTEVTEARNLRAIVGAICNVLELDKRAAVEKAKHLPLTLAVNLPEKDAKLMANMFSSLGAGIEVTPPLDDELARPLREPRTELPKKGIPLGCLLFIMFILVGFAVFASMQYEWIRAQFQPNPEKSERQLQKGDMYKAKRSIQRQLRENPANTDLLILQGKYYIGAARKRMSEEKWKTLGEAGAMPELDSAVFIFRKAESINPKNSAIPRWISIAEQMRRAMSEAETAARRAVALDPQDPDNWNQLGSVLISMDQVSQAELAFYNALKIDKNDFAALKNMAILNLYYAKDADRASKYLFAFLEHKDAFADYDSFNLRTDLATAMLGDFNPPFDKLSPPPLPFEEYERRRAHIAADPRSKNNPMLQEQLGMLHLSIGETKAAEYAFMKALELNARYESSRKMLAIIYMKEPNYERALRTMEAAVDNGAKDPFFWKNIGVLQKYYKADHSEANKAFGRYMSMGGDSYSNRIRKEIF